MQYLEQSSESEFVGNGLHKHHLDEFVLVGGGVLKESLNSMLTVEYALGSVGAGHNNNRLHEYGTSEGLFEFLLALVQLFDVLGINGPLELIRFKV